MQRSLRFSGCRIKGKFLSQNRSANKNRLPNPTPHHFNYTITIII